MCTLWSPAGKGLTSWLSFVVSICELDFPIGILGRVWYLIVSIPDLCTLTYFVFSSKSVQFPKGNGSTEVINGYKRFGCPNGGGGGG